MEPTSPQQLKMIELFQTEIETQVKTLSEGLLTYQHSNGDLKLLEPLMRAAHSIKGAARVFFFESMVQLAHAIEDCLVAAKEGKLNLDDDRSEILFQALDAISSSVNVPKSELFSKMSLQQEKFIFLTTQIANFIHAEDTQNVKSKDQTVNPVFNEQIADLAMEQRERVLKFTAQNLNRLMGLSAESMVETRWLRPFCDSLLNLKLSFNQIFNQLDFLKNSLNADKMSETSEAYLLSLRHLLRNYQNEFSDKVTDLEMFITRHSNLTDRLYTEVIESRMRPFDDGVNAFPRMVWETARRLKKKARLEIIGKSTLIDRDILERLEAPLGHLLRNAIDHGIESSEERIAKGKSPEGTIYLEASHKSGMLAISVCDDGQGIDLQKLKQKIIKNKMIAPELVEKLTSQELFEFMYLPGFTTSDSVSDVSGRGMGLNVVQNMLQEVSGTVFIENRPGKGVCFNMQLPLTRSVSRALIARVGQGTFAFPLARIEQAVTFPINKIEKIDTREYINFLGNYVGLVPAVQVLGINATKPNSSILSVVILYNRKNYYGVVVDEFLGEKELVLQDLESRLGKIPCISSGSVLENGDPVLIVDVEDMTECIDKLLEQGKLYNFQHEEQLESKAKKRILVVDDSVSVREVECRLLSKCGFNVDSAVNGAEAWNAIRLEKYDLVVTDVDMPRLSGIELVRRIKNDERFKKMPIMIVSYKERENDRLAGLDAGANYYLAKSTFGDEALVKAVKELIGEP